MEGGIKFESDNNTAYGINSACKDGSCRACRYVGCCCTCGNVCPRSRRKVSFWSYGQRKEAPQIIFLDSNKKGVCINGSRYNNCSFWYSGGYRFLS